MYKKITFYVVQLICRIQDGMSIKHESITSATCVWRAVSVPLEILVWKRSGYCGYVCGEVFLDLRAQVV